MKASFKMEPAMNPPVDRRSGASWPQAVVGAALAFTGLAVLAGLFVIIYGDREPFHTYAVDLGLAGTALISAGAQVAVLVGLWLVWRGTAAPKPRRGGARRDEPVGSPSAGPRR